MPEAQTLTRSPELADDDRPTPVDSAVLEKPFATPVVASFDMDSLEMGSASALTPNGRTDTSE